ncbi:hypothetical protein ACE1CB_08120 [Aerosakkonema sp. BLCC-F2]
MLIILQRFALKAKFINMAIPPEIAVLIDQLNQELNWTEREATEGLNLTRSLLSRFPNNVVLIQFFASLGNILIFVESYRRRIQLTVEPLLPVNVPTEIIQDAGEELATMLGVVLEVKINASRLKTDLENL